MSGEASADEKPNFGGKYVLVRNENFNQFLAANGRRGLTCYGFIALTDQLSVNDYVLKCAVLMLLCYRYHGHCMLRCNIVI